MVRIPPFQGGGSCSIHGSCIIIFLPSSLLKGSNHGYPRTIPNSTASAVIVLLLTTVFTISEDYSTNMPMYSSSTWHGIRVVGKHRLCLHVLDQIGLETPSCINRQNIKASITLKISSKSYINQDGCPFGNCPGSHHHFVWAVHHSFLLLRWDES